jgi:hypothetical protein
MPLFSRRNPQPVEAPALPYEPGSPEGLAARWVRWVAASGPLANPVEDETGKFGAENQPDDVWFLAGTSGKRMSRNLVVPPGRDLFLPAFNIWFYPADGPPEDIPGLPEALASASGSLTVDGVSLDLDVISTPLPFVVAGARLNGVTGRKKPVPATVWGLWKRVPALEPGEHHLRAVGTDGGDFSVDVTYRLLVSTGAPNYQVR